MKLELDSQERRAVAKSLLERRGRLIENAEDTTRPRAAKQSALLELAAIKSVLRKLRGDEMHGDQRRKHENGGAEGTRSWIARSPITRAISLGKAPGVDPKVESGGPIMETCCAGGRQRLGEARIG